MSPRQIFVLMRPEHWVKNLFLFIPAFFAARLDEPSVLYNAMMGFVAFCLIASAVYVLNDMVDATQDRNHPDKNRRPVASGAISIRQAIAILVLLLFFSTALAAYLRASMLIFSLLYFVINLFYSFSLKHIAIIDISLIGL